MRYLQMASPRTRRALKDLRPLNENNVSFLLVVTVGFLSVPVLFDSLLKFTIAV